MTEEAIEAAARAIAGLWWDTFPINEPGRKEWWLNQNWRNYIDQARAALSAYHDAEIENLRSQLADCRAVLRKMGHRPGCPAIRCAFIYVFERGHAKCGASGAADHDFAMQMRKARGGEMHQPHEFQPGECTCGYARVMGEG